MRAQDGVATGEARHGGDQWTRRAETPAKPSQLGVVQPQHNRAGVPLSPLASLAPWVVAAVAVVALMIVLSRGDDRQSTQISPEVPRVSAPSAELADRLADQQERINRLTSKLESLSEVIAAPSARKTSGAIAPASPPAARRKAEPRGDPEAPARAAVAQDLDKLRQYAKEIADSVALIDTQISDPATLQRKLEHQKALIRPQAQ